MPFLLSSVLFQYPLMILFPLVLGWWIRRRYRVGWGIFWAGAATFILSQSVHLPPELGAGPELSHPNTNRIA
jgi:predicted cobalt transporter CbtA